MEFSHLIERNELVILYTNKCCTSFSFSFLCHFSRDRRRDDNNKSDEKKEKDEKSEKSEGNGAEFGDNAAVKDAAASSSSGSVKNDNSDGFGAAASASSDRESGDEKTSSEPMGVGSLLSRIRNGDGYP